MASWKIIQSVELLLHTDKDKDKDTGLIPRTHMKKAEVLTHAYNSGVREARKQTKRNVV